MHQDIVQTRYWWSGCPRRTAPVQYCCCTSLPSQQPHGTGAAQQYQKAEPDPTGRVGHDLCAAGLHPLGLPPLSRHVHHRDWIRLAAGRPVWEGGESLHPPRSCELHLANACTSQAHAPAAQQPKNTVRWQRRPHAAAIATLACPSWAGPCRRRGAPPGLPAPAGSALSFWRSPLRGPARPAGPCPGRSGSSPLDVCHRRCVLQPTARSVRAGPWCCAGRDIGGAAQAARALVLLSWPVAACKHRLLYY